VPRYAGCTVLRHCDITLLCSRSSQISRCRNTCGTCNAANPALKGLVWRCSVGGFFNGRLDCRQPKLLDCSNVELTGTVPKRSEHFSLLFVVEHNALAKIGRKGWIAVNKEAVHDAAIVCDDISDVDTERSVRRIGVLCEQHEI